MNDLEMLMSSADTLPSGRPLNLRKIESLCENIGVGA